MPLFSGTFLGNVETQAVLTVGDQENHDMMLAQVRGPQQSPDASWNDATITYSALLDLVAGKGTQRGYFVNVHLDGGSDWGTFEGNVAPVDGELRCEGTWESQGGSGRYQEMTGKGTFKMRMPSPTTFRPSLARAFAS
jgi:hypothetical protein